MGVGILMAAFVTSQSTSSPQWIGGAVGSPADGGDVGKFIFQAFRNPCILSPLAEAVHLGGESGNQGSRSAVAGVALGCGSAPICRWAN